MGTIIAASCECGYAKRMFLGGGFRDFATRNAFPYLCRDCSDMVVLNAMDPEPRCDRCQGAAVKSYSDPCMFLDQPLGRVVHQWGKYPSSEILRAPSAERYADAYVQALLADDSVDPDTLLSEAGIELIELRRELVADYQSTWEKVRAGEYRALYDCGYPCPGCGHKTLHFRQAGHWD